MNFGSCKAYKKSLRHSALSAVKKFFNGKSLKDDRSKYVFTKKMNKCSIYNRMQYNLLYTQQFLNSETTSHSNMAIFKKKYQKFSDEQLMVTLQHGDTFAFDELYNRYNKRLLHYFYRTLGGDAEKAQDFLQDLFLKIVEKPRLFHTEKKFASWVFTLAHNLCINEYRRLEVRKVIENNGDMDGLAPGFDEDYYYAEQTVDQKMFEKALLLELEKMEAGHRSVFLLRYQQNFSIKEISEILGCSAGTVKSRLFYTTRKLARKLKAFNPYNAEVA